MVNAENSVGWELLLIVFNGCIYQNYYKFVLRFAKAALLKILDVKKKIPHLSFEKKKKRVFVCFG